MSAVSKLTWLAGVAAVAIAAPAASPAAAADSPSVQELVVTADKREENAKDVPQSVTAISGATLDAERAVTFEDYITQVPGMNLVASQAGSARLVLRGVNAGGVSATIGTYVDETPYGSVTGLANGAVLAPDLDTFDMKRLEVLRGPQGTLYGASSLGGLLKFVMNAPDPSQFDARGEIDGDGVNKGGDGGSVKAMVNIPLTATAAFRASGYYSEQPGYIDDPLRGAKDVNGARYDGVRLGFLYKPMDNFTIRLSAVGQDISSHGSNTEDVNPTTLQPLYGDLTQSRTFSSPNVLEYRIYNATITYDFGPANLTSATSYGTLHQTTNEDATAQYGPLLSGAFKTPVGVGLYQELDQQKFTQEVRLASPTQQFEWQVGGFFTREDNLLHQSLNALSLASAPQVLPGLAGLEVVQLPSTYDEYAGFGDIDYHFTDRFDLSLGGRYSHNEQRSSQTTSGLLVGPTPSVVGGTSSEGVFTFAVAPKYKLSDDATLYARISKGYRPGGPNALSPLAPAAVPRTFQSDSLINYEVGVKGDAMDHQVAYDLSAFYIDWSRIQLLAAVDNFGVNTNGGSAVSKGVEGNVSWAATQELTLSANAAYIQANLTSDTGPLLGGHDGDRLPYVSPISGALDANYSHALSGDLKGFLGGSVRFTGRRRSDFNATIGQLSLPSYTQVDLRAGVEWSKYRAELFAKNIGDSRGILSIGGYGATPNGAVQAGLITPRLIGVSLSARY